MPDKTTIVVKCPCGANLRVSASAAGKRIRCPKCGEPFRVKPPAPTTTTPIPPAAPVEDDLLGSFGESESSAASMESHRSPFDEDAIRCNQCGAKMQADARLCTACGFDTVTGKMLSGATAASSGAKAASSVAEAGKAAAGAAAPFLMGTFLSMIGAGIGGAIWFAIGHYTGYEVGYVAIGVGFLAGLGMAIGYPEHNTKAGVVASCMAVIGILSAKFVIFAAVAVALATGNTADHGLQRAFVNSMVAEEILDDRGLETDEQREAQAQTAAMGREEIHERRTEYLDILEAEIKIGEEELAEEQELAEGEPADGSLSGDVADASVGVASAFFQTMFGPLDFLFIFLAIGAAYRTASGLSRDLE